MRTHCGKVIQDDAEPLRVLRQARGGSDGSQTSGASRADRKIAGVCAGLAEYFDLDITLVRVLWLIVTFFSGIIPGLVGYVVAWIVMPEEPVHAVVPQGEQVTTP